LYFVYVVTLYWYSWRCNCWWNNCCCCSYKCSCIGWSGYRSCYRRVYRLSYWHWCGSWKGYKRRTDWKKNEGNEGNDWK